MSRTLNGLIVSIAIIGSALAVAAPPAAAASYTVCASGCGFTDIQSAINAASAGDTVLVRPGTYPGALAIDRAVTVCSTTAAGSACNPNPANVKITTANIYPIYITSDDVTFRGFTIDNGAYTQVDGPLGFVDTGTVVVQGVDNVVVSDNIIDHAASVPLPGESRMYTIGVSIGLGSDNVQVLRNTMQNFPPGSAGSCLNAPCAVEGIHNWGQGSGFVAKGNDIRFIGSTAPAFGIIADRNPGTVVDNNFIRMPTSAPGSDPIVVGIDLGISDGAIVKNNDIAVTAGSTPGGLYGIWCICQNSEFSGNLVQLAQHGIGLRTNAVGNNNVHHNTIKNSYQGVLNFADNTLIQKNDFSGVTGAGVYLDSVDAPGGPYSMSENVLINENKFRQTPIVLSVSDTVHDLAIDATENDWGVYTSDLISTRIDDATGTNAIDFSCFIANDGTTRVCPIAAFTVTTSGASWPRTVTLTDTSTFPGSENDTRAWTLPGGATSSDPVVTLSLVPGSYTFDLAVTDAEGFADAISQSLSLSNSAPVLVLDATYAATEGAPFSLLAAATDADSDALQYAIVSGPAGLSIGSTTGAIAWTPGYATAGDHDLIVTATDGAVTALATTTIQVVDTPVGALLSLSGVTMSELTTIDRNIVATSPAGSAIALSATGLPAGATFTDGGAGTAVLSFAAPSGSAGTYPITVEAVSEGITTSGTFNLVVVKTVGFTLDRVTATTARSSPGQTIPLTGSLQNTGSGSDTFHFTLTNNKGWAYTVPGDLTLAPGDSSAVTATITLPANADLSFVMLKACSATSPSLCKTLSWRVEAPIVVSMSILPVGLLGGAVTANVSVNYLDSSPVNGATITFTERSEIVNLFLLTSSATGSTDSSGFVSIEDADPLAKVYGGHSVSLVVKHGDIQNVLSAHYEVGPSL